MESERRKTDSAQDTRLWYKDAIIYQLHVKTFYDSDGDGIGDFRGLTEKLGYLQKLGVTAVWLLPFYPSPLKDDGYDIADFKGINPNFGNLRQFKAFLREAHRLGLRVITELVINHTSDQHPWFQRARRAKPGSVWRDFYVWSDTPTKYAETRVIFKDFETSNWTWDPAAKAYYWHRFYSHQPDLNYDNPKVHDAVLQALDFWMDMGVDGLRLDAIPYLYEREGTNCENLPETHAFLKKLREHMDSKYRDRMFLGEANQWPEDAVEYFGSGDECHMSFHFPLMPRLYMALQMEDRFPVIDILQQTPAIPESCQWAIFLRNHDELTLEMVTDEERDYMYRMYAQDPRMRLNLGIRRRLAPLLGNHRRRIELMNGFLLSLPGTPVIYYGDEIGMGDNIFLGDRNGVRTPMQWSADRNAGFSRVNPHELNMPVIIDPEYHYEVFNVEAQENNRHSLLWWMRRLIALRNRIKAFSRGSLELLDPENPRILAFIRRCEDQNILVVANFSRFVQFVQLDLAQYAGFVPLEIFGNTPFPEIEEEDYYFLTLGPHSFYWFNLQPAEIEVEAGLRPAAADRIPVVKVRERWEEVFEGRDGGALQKHIRTYLYAQRWFGAKGRDIKSVALRDSMMVRDRDMTAFINIIRLEYIGGTAESYILPLTYLSEENAVEILEENPLAAVARVQFESGPRQGYIVDAFMRDEFAQALFWLTLRRSSVRGRTGRLTSTPSRQLKKMFDRNELPFETQVVKAEQSNTSVIYGSRFILKLFRRLQDGINPDLEVGRFLTNKGFENLPAVVGSIEFRREKAEPDTVAIMQAFVPNQGDAWEYTLESLYLYFEYVLTHCRDKMAPLPRDNYLELARQDVSEETARMIGYYLESVRLLARRTAQMHTFLASDSDDPAFAPEAFSKLYQRSLYQSMRSLFVRVMGQFQKQLKNLPADVQESGRKILDSKQDLMASLKSLIGRKIEGKRLRCHGDYHLGQVLYTGKDFMIIDFEGEPARPISERRIKHSPLRDVAGMLRSFHYAAYSALMAEQSRGLFQPEELPLMESWADFWHLWVTAVFIRHYFDEVPQGSFLPEKMDQWVILLDALLLEKAVYELGYELNNRPGWIKIPLKGIEQLMSRTELTP